jgi:hypothetical protein
VVVHRKNSAPTVNVPLCSLSFSLACATSSNIKTFIPKKAIYVCIAVWAFAFAEFLINNGVGHRAVLFFLKEFILRL